MECVATVFEQKRELALKSGIRRHTVFKDPAAAGLGAAGLGAAGLGAAGLWGNAPHTVEVCWTTIIHAHEISVQSYDCGPANLYAQPCPVD